MQNPEQGTEEQNLGSWLTLSLVKNPESHESPLPQSRGAVVNVFFCSFCRRNFFSSQALGGHQNAHRKERGLLLRCQPHSMLTTMKILSEHPRSLGLHAQSHVRKPGRDEPATVSRSVLGWQPPALEEAAADSMWAGSPTFDPHQSEQNSMNFDEIDLDLKL